MAAIRAAAATTALITPRSQIAGRAVYIKIHPRPRNISESRQILRVLERYGEVVMYKHLKYEPQAPAPNTALAIYQHEGAATNLLDASPLRFVLEGDARGDMLATAHDLGGNQQAQDLPVREVVKEDVEAGLEDLEKSVVIPETGETAESSEWGFMARYPQRSAESMAEAGNVKETHSQASRPTELGIPPIFPSNAEPPSHHDVRHREFQLTISRSHLNHQAYIERQAYYGPFNPDTRSIMAEDLESRVPLKGLADCKLGKEEVPLRIRQKRKEKDAERGWVGLKGLWEMGQRENKGHGTPVK